MPGVIGNIGLRTKIAATLVAVIALLGAVAILQAQHDLRRILRRDLRERGLAIAKDIASRSANPALTNDLFAIYELINDSLINNDDVRYVMLLDPAGEVLVHSFGAAIPKGLRQANVLPADATEQVKLLATEEGLIQDIAVLVHEGRVGVVRVGMSEVSVNAAVGNLIRKLLALVGLAVLVGIGASYGLATLLTRPISYLAQAVKAVARGDLAWRTQVGGKDEIGQLGTAFNAMTEQLARSREELTARNKELTLLSERLQETLGKIITAQEEERRRLARELHDEAGQGLGALSISLDRLGRLLTDASPQVRAEIEQARDMTRSMLDETRRLVYDLRPSVLDDMGLESAIRWCAETHLQQRGVEVTLQSSLAARRLSSPIEVALFRVAQEAIINIGRHAQAQHAGIVLEERNSTLGMRVWDDGRGFDLARVENGPGHSGLGLEGMRERVRLIGGRMEVLTAPGEGTVINVEVPLD